MEARLIQFDPIADKRGKLVSLEGLINVPFAIKRVFYIYDVGPLTKRGGHAHKKCHQLLVPVCGSCAVILEELPANAQYYYLSHLGEEGLYVPPGLKITLEMFSPNCVLLVLASEYYDPEDYEQDTVQRLAAPALAEAVAG